MCGWCFCPFEENTTRKNTRAHTQGDTQTVYDCILNKKHSWIISVQQSDTIFIRMWLGQKTYTHDSFWNIINRYYRLCHAMITISFLNQNEKTHSHILWYFLLPSLLVLLLHWPENFFLFLFRVMFLSYKSGMIENTMGSIAQYHE